MHSLRRRGKAGTFYIRGSVSLDGKVIFVPEYSTGTCDEPTAEHLVAQLHLELRHQLLFGPKAKLARACLADAFDAYLTKPVPPNSTDVSRIGILNDRIGALPLDDPHAAWNDFREEYLLDHAPSGQDRYRSLIQACVNVYHEKHGLPAVRLKVIPFANERIRFLSHSERDRLIASYPRHIQPIATIFAFQGARTQEVLQLPWGAAGIDMGRGTIFFGRTKTGNPRTVEMHPRVETLLGLHWFASGRPKEGHVFLNRIGKPFADTRDQPIQGGNPLRHSHEGACQRAGIADFRVHDWRHHWASHCVMAGIDLPTIMRLGGWKSLRMIQRYAAVDTAHMREAILKLS
jgi:integrase